MIRIPESLTMALCLAIFLLPTCKRDDNASNSIAGKTVRSIYIDPNGTKWFATDKGISSFDGKTWTNFDEKDGLPVAGYNDLSNAASADGINLWLASTRGVVMGHWDANMLTVEATYTTGNSELLNDTILAIAIDKAGYLWMGTNRGLNGLKNNTEWIIQPKDVFFLPITRIGSSEDGWNYFATLGGGVARNKTAVDGITSASIYETPWAGLPSDSINALYIDRVTGNQWFGTPAGAAYHVGTETKKNWTVYTTLEGLVDDFVLTIAGDSEGNIWFGTNGGVSRFGNSNWTSYTESDGLASNTVYAIAFDSDGSVWFGTDKGVSHYTSGTWVTYR
jgi:ligand-binding sensor domain-containing protein